MSLRLIPFADRGVPDTRSGRRLIIWLEHQQRRGQALAVFWGLLYFGGIAAAPVAVGLAVPALFTGFAQVAFKSQANGSLIHRTCSARSSQACGTHPGGGRG